MDSDGIESIPEASIPFPIEVKPDSVERKRLEWYFKSKKWYFDV